jgi:alpha-methylacyl-CoA racemase
MIGDFGGGGMLLAFGIVSGVLSARASGKGQVIDCAMVDGSALLMSMIRTFSAQGRWLDQRGVNFLDSGAHFYDTYETSDGKHVAIGCIEPQFYAEFRRRTGLAAEWCDIFESADACFAPVLSLTEAPMHPHNLSRGTFLDIDGVVQPAPAPRFTTTPAAPPRMPREAGADGDALLTERGYTQSEIDALRESGVLC